MTLSSSTAATMIALVTEKDKVPILKLVSETSTSRYSRSIYFYISYYAILKLPNVIVALVSTVGTETTSAATAKLNVPILKSIAGTITSGWSISVLATAKLKLPIANV